ncbi:HD domain-containing protein [Maribellus sp. YY47]|uniref:HD domain-containing protein n=1 Tax=Maribellus sp. YY47 TaxID=2929486 RepID=UPI002001B067|nr:HD domain-containing protein [Maribellus sp. YY47]MCK3685526.1 HD domain-containing protein [Maribellus sp. YY47]
MNSNIQEKEVIKRTEAHVKQLFDGEGSGHDWWHIYRVRNLALKISEKEGGDLFIIEMAALLHDLDDWKLKTEKEASRTEAWLHQVQVDNDQQERILQVISEVSFKGAEVETLATTTEAKIVQDADRLDAIGAIGIARTFAYGGNKGRSMYDPETPPVMHNNFEAYKKNNGPTINHFYEKLLLLKDRLNTVTAIEMAEKRHTYMETFLARFCAEWDGEI